MIDDLPTPPLPEAMSRTRVRLDGSAKGMGARAVAVGRLATRPVGMPLVAVAVPPWSPMSRSRSAARSSSVMTVNARSTTVDAVERLDRAGDPVGDLGAQRAAGHGEGDQRPARRPPSTSIALHHAEIDDAAVQLGILDRPERVEHGRLGGRASSVDYWPMDRAPLTPAEFPSAVTAITSAFGDPTRRDIYLFAREPDDGVTATEVAERFELHPNVARHHLDKLAGGGYLEVGVAAPTARAGRPSKRYRPSARDGRLDLPRSATTTCSSPCSARRSRCCRPTQAEAMAEEVGVEYGRSVARVGRRPATPTARSGPRCTRWPTPSPPTASPPTPSAGAPQLRIVTEHCPFGDAAIEHPVICAVDRGMVKGMLHASTARPSAAIESSLPMGDDVCVTAVRG